MTLNKQLLCISLLLLSLPWAGCQYLKEMNNTLRQSQQTTLQATTDVIAKALAQNPEALHPHGQVGPGTTAPQAIYCQPLNSPVRADGYDEEWRSLSWSDYPSQGQQKLRYRCGIYRDELALLFVINDQQVIYNNPTRSLAANGDRLVLTTGSGRDYIFTAVAPGKIIARYFKNPHTTYRESQIDAAWLDQKNGYQLEIKMPLPFAKGKLSFLVIDESDGGIHRYGPSTEQVETPWFIYQAPAIKQTLKPFSQNGLRLRLINSQGLLLATAGNPEPPQTTQGHWLLRKAYRAMLASGESRQPLYTNSNNLSGRKEVSLAQTGTSSSQWYQEPERSTHQILTIANPIKVDGNVTAVLLAEQSSEQTAALTDQAFSRLFLLSLTVISITVFGLLAYASWLSWRIRRLSKATQDALDDQGKLSKDYPKSRANDEIGLLTRNYSELMKRIAEYTDYLQTLSRKLSHELRTPLAIIHSSLDNLESQALEPQSKIYQQRAKDGAMRLGNILTAMSEARRVEESLEHAEPEPTNIAALLWEVSQAYKDLYREHKILLEGFDQFSKDDSDNQLNLVPDLIVQMLDKLMDNASSFCPEDGKIIIGFSSTATEVAISISNEGTLLPEAMQKQLFDNMVSVRQQDDQQTHLGLGLHIVSLIVKHHHGQVFAANRVDNSGVIFTVILKRSET